MASLFKSDNISYRPLLSTPRSLPAKVLCAVAVFYVIYAAHSLLSSSSTFFSFSVSRPRSICTPQAWASGKWVPKLPPTMRTNFTKSEDVYEFLGFQGCASNREVYWHLAADNERLFDRFPSVASWRWSPPAEECSVRDLDPTVLVRDLVEQGGWLLIGGKHLSTPIMSISA